MEDTLSLYYTKKTSEVISGILFSLFVKPHNYGFDSFVKFKFFMPWRWTNKFPYEKDKLLKSMN